jgi:hypothetical protein
VSGDTVVWDGIDAPGESYQDFMDGFGGLIFETFSPRLYYAALTGDVFGGTTRNVYLVAINPEVTLQLLLETVPREGPMISNGAGHLDHPVRAACFGQLDEGLQIPALVCELAPDVAMAYRDRIVDFVGKYSTFYRTPRSYSASHPEPIWKTEPDARARKHAFHVLDLIGLPEDIPIVEDLMKDRPWTPEDTRQRRTVSDVTIIGTDLLYKLRAMR